MNFSLEKITWENAFLYVVKPLLILLVCNLVIKAILRVLGKVLDKTHLDKGIKTFAQSFTRIALWVICIIFIADSLGVNTASLVTVLGVVTLAMSMSLQTIMTNLFSGITVLVSKPFVVGDFIEVNGMIGTVTEIRILNTIILTTDNKKEIIPNGDVVSAKVVNYSAEPLRRVDLTVTASYDSPTEDVYDAVLGVAAKDERVLKDADHAPFCRISNYNANDIEYTIRFWTENANYWGVYFDTLEALRPAFAAKGVQFSYPHVNVHMDK